VVDINNDSKPDIIVANQMSNNIGILLACWNWTQILFYLFYKILL
jgi:hypothetical protein